MYVVDSNVLPVGLVFQVDNVEKWLTDRNYVWIDYFYITEFFRRWNVPKSDDKENLTNFNWVESKYFDFFKTILGGCGNK